MENMIDHTVTQEDLDANASLVEANIEVGDVVQVPASNEAGSVEGWIVKPKAEDEEEEEEEKVEDEEETSPAPEEEA